MDTPLKVDGSIFKFIAALFKRHQVRGILVGGYALIANNVQRMTFDIDCMVTAADLEKMEPDILGAGYSIFSRQDAFVQFRSNTPGLRDIDFLIGDRHTIDTIISGGKQVTIAGESFVVPGPLHLIAMKLHSIAGNKMREIKDLPDIVQLLKANAIDLTDGRIRELFDKYKLTEIYKRVSTVSGGWHGK
ncbi:MAG: hypothetical protein JW863_04195 [Chitinispirillaceae bacterium]|nr:hypothetical protein [Chitinispirillaceae bacterium]